ncbi:hypothetical protein BG000_005544, partial [Podila horticola]
MKRGYGQVTGRYATVANDKASYWGEEKLDEEQLDIMLEDVELDELVTLQRSDDEFVDKDEN